MKNNLSKTKTSLTPHQKSLIGRKFGKLTVLRFSGIRLQGACRYAFYEALCECGVVKDVKGTHLTQGDTKSCGCLNYTKLPDNQAKLNSKLSCYKRHAKDRGLCWKISKPFFESLCRMRCFYCNSRPEVFNGVDRINNTEGYEDYNVIPCCKLCNRSKSDRDVEEFISWATEVATYHGDLNE